MRNRAALFGSIHYKIHAPEVKAFHESTALTRIISAPARTSKSFSSGPELAHDFFPRTDRKTGKPLRPTKGDLIRCWAVGVDYESTKEWEYADEILYGDKLIEKCGGQIERRHNNKKQGNLEIIATWGTDPKGRVVRSILHGKSAQNRTSLESEAVRLGVMCEAANHDAWVHDKCLQTRCDRLILPTTPKRKAMWIWEMIQNSQGAPETGIECFTFTPRANPKYDWGVYHKARILAELKCGPGRAHEDPEFAEQFLGSWVFEGGKVLPFRWMDLEDGMPSHVIGDVALEDQLAWAEWFVSCDYGYSDPAVALLWAHLPDDTLVIWDEVYERNLHPSKFVDRIRGMVEEWGVRPSYYVGDPRKPEIADIMQGYGLGLYPVADKNLMSDREAGGMALVQMLSLDPQTNDYRLHVHQRCANTIVEWKNLRRKEDWGGDPWATAALPKKCRDDAFDAARYGATTVVREQSRSGRTGYARRLRARLEHARRAALRGRRAPSRGSLVGPSPSLWGAN